MVYAVKNGVEKKIREYSNDGVEWRLNISLLMI